MGAEVALEASRPVFLAELARSGRPRGSRCGLLVALPAVCRAPGLFLGRVVPTVLFFLGENLVRPGCVLAAVLAGVGGCAGVWCCSAPVRVLCVSPRSRPPPPCVFEQYGKHVPYGYT